MKILLMAAELFPFIKTGGLGDYVEALGNALHKSKDLDVRVAIPGYPCIKENLVQKKELLQAKNLLYPSHNIKLVEGKLKEFSPKVIVVENNLLYEREGNPYVDKEGNEWPDNFERFATLSMVPYLLVREKSNWIPDVVHANDWHTGLFSAYLKLLSKENKIKTVFVIHNLAFQGNFMSLFFRKSGLNKKLFNINGIEYFGKLSFLKAGITQTDKVVTVSPRYAYETTHSSDFGFGFEKILKNKGTEYLGILNGVDYKEWDPKTDKKIKYNYGIRSLDKKIEQKLWMQSKAGINVDEKAFVLGSVTRFSHQKGLDILAQVLKQLLPYYSDLQFICLGTGDSDLEEEYEKLSKQFPKQVKFYNIYDEELSHQLIASADSFVIPSRFEPCGLTQLYSLKYGTVPIVTPVGGLYDSIEHIHISKNKVKGIGFVTHDVSIRSLEKSIYEAFKLYQKEPVIWAKLIQNCMKADFSWEKSVKKYLEIYTQ